MAKEPRKGLVIVLTGKGKGKTTCALGMAFRACGQGLKALMLQFIKGSWRYGELETAKRLATDFEIRPLGKGFVMRKGPPTAEDLAVVAEGWRTAREEVLSGRYDMVILDEVNYVVDYKLLPVADVLALIRERPPQVHLVLTGRNAHPDVIAAADLVTEMVEVKHPFRQGVKAIKGIEF
ncbi:MAG: cob(I)yrinic acid a,c-diamide adenosyltransferase [Planctomycetes bacterium]|nr:cob(I)yrinic acid a,c-diamide adenosyltransferase [Planctomycetota bacterium]